MTDLDMTKLCAEAMGLRKDAQRYRWLHKQVSHADFTPIAQCVWKRNSDPNAMWVNLIDGEDMNNHIDAALAETEKA